MIIQSKNEFLVMIVVRLRELADGAQPHREKYGICDDIHSSFINHWEDSYQIISQNVISREVFENAYPLGENDYRNENLPKWTGDIGEHRRTLAGLAASFIETELMGYE